MKHLVQVLGALALGSGVTCQFVQDTNPAPPLVYFTVWSALLGAATLMAAALQRRPPASYLTGAATVGSIVSGLVFTLVIAPQTVTGTWFQPWDDVWVRAANVLLHAIGPALIGLNFLLTQPLEARPWRAAACWCWWPALYLLGIFTAQALGGPVVPYPFLDVQQTSWAVIMLALVVLSLVFLVIGSGLLHLAALARRKARFALPT